MGVSTVRQLSPLLGRRSRWLRALLALAVAGGVATFSPSAASAVAPSGYVNPLRAAQGLIAERIDEGVDYVAAGGSPIYALGNGSVTEVYNTGWPNGVFLVYQLTSGPAQGWYVYVAEDLAPAVSVGQQVTSGTVLGRFEAGADHGYDIEMGWADPCSCGQALAATYGQYPVDGDATALGRSFNDLMRTLGVASGSIQGPETGSTLDGQPIWSALKPVRRVFFAGGNGHLFESVFRNTKWRGEHDMCASQGWGCPAGSAAGVAVNPATDDQYVFWRDAQGDIKEAFHQSGEWRGPINMCTRPGWGCRVASAAPDLAVGDDGNQYVVYRGANGHIYEAFHRSGAWHGGYDTCASLGWGCLPSSAASIAVNPANDKQYVFWRGVHGGINEAVYRSGAWHGPINMCTKRGWGCRVASAAPDVAVGDDGSRYVVYTGANGHIYEALHRGGAWHGGLDMCAAEGWGCTPSSAASIAVNPANDQQYVFWRGAHGNINEAFQRSGAWHGPINMCTTEDWGCRVASAAPSVAVSASATPAPPAETSAPRAIPGAGSKPSKPSGSPPSAPAPPTSSAPSSPSPSVPAWPTPSAPSSPTSAAPSSPTPTAPTSPTSTAPTSPTPTAPTSPTSTAPSSPTRKPSPKPSSPESPTSPAKSASSSARASAKPSPSSSNASPLSPTAPTASPSGG